MFGPDRSCGNLGFALGWEGKGKTDRVLEQLSCPLGLS